MRSRAQLAAESVFAGTPIPGVLRHEYRVEGRVLAQGKPADVVRDPNVISAYWQFHAQPLNRNRISGHYEIRVERRDRLGKLVTSTSSLRDRSFCTQQVNNNGKRL
jgi:hypothetical protein